MTDACRILQAQGGYKREFAFGTERLTCKLRDPSGAREFSVPYETIDVSSPSTLTLNRTPLARWLALLGMLSFIAALTTGSAGLPGVVSGSFYAAGMALVGVVIANRWTGWLSATFTVMRLTPPPPGTTAALMVINDARHDEVMQALREKWKERLRALYARVDPDRDHKQEIARLSWLREKGVIDDLHFQAEVGRLNAPDAEKLPARTIN